MSACHLNADSPSYPPERLEYVADAIMGCDECRRRLLVRYPVEALALSLVLIDRLRSKINTQGSFSACWEWTGALSQKRDTRRPNFWHLGKAVNPARIICALAHGAPKDPTLQVGHTCPEGENARCVNPAHLRWVWPWENQAMKKRRTRS